MIEVEKPAELAKRGGCWFASGGVPIPLGVEEDFRPAQKVNPALGGRGYAALLARLRARMLEVNEGENIPGVRRCHIFDAFGNRLELVAG
jgi:hypothetical protein